MKYHVEFFHHAQGMEFPDRRNFGEWDAANPADAIDKVMEASFKGCTKADAEYIRGCLSARMVGSFPNLHAPRTDDVVLVRKDSIQGMAKILCLRIMEPPMGYEEEVWQEHKEMFMQDVRAMLGLPEEDENGKVI